MSDRRTGCSAGLQEFNNELCEICTLWTWDEEALYPFCSLAACMDATECGYNKQEMPRG